MSSGHGSGGHGRRPKKHVEHEEHENHERWAVSYADMMTVLVGLFIVMYAVSQVDEVKYEQLRKSLAIGFGNDAPTMLVGGGGALDSGEAVQITPDLTVELPSETMLVENKPQTPVEAQTEAERLTAAAVAEYERLEGIADRIQASLDAQQLSDRVRFRISERGLVVGLVADDVFFAADRAHLAPTAERVLDAIAPVLREVQEEISVEGHANVVPTAAYPTNWELSSDRATQVLRRLVEVGGLPPTRTAAVGYGDARPLDPSNTPQALEANRRVDLVVLSPAPDEVRRLLPQLAATMR
ncbi:flagellar motor protein MotB [Cellulomonas carbonis]|uniref:Flagellar motor protein MotB n=1 Tax=Cellulomonas carbonis T26 TaxID=947969 RepID=A0A0A0BLV8_9CELL|nr:OmpA family protein [Cellulomonas carbonis]KGM08850.1 flagellar motor protein MotB [Cellulomonas carbonis T26]GGC01648.1 chemotaxis protein MotB [Cellulomonas carbonis]